MSWRPPEGCAEARVNWAKSNKSKTGWGDTHENQTTWGAREVGRTGVSLLEHYSCQQVMEELLKAHLHSRILKESAMSLQEA